MENKTAYLPSSNCVVGCAMSCIKIVYKISDIEGFLNGIKVKNKNAQEYGHNAEVCFSVFADLKLSRTFLQT